MTHATRGILVVAGLLAFLAAACEDDDDPSKTECGYPENGCWSDKTCNTGATCNTGRAGESLGSDVCPGTYGVCEATPDIGTPDTGPTPDQGPAPDKGPQPDATDGAVIDGPGADGPGPDGPLPDTTTAVDSAAGE